MIIYYGIDSKSIFLSEFLWYFKSYLPYKFGGFKNKIIKKKWNLNHYELNYLNQLKHVISNKNDIAATYEEGSYIMQLINKIEEFKS